MDREFVDFIIEERIRMLSKQDEIMSEEEIKQELEKIFKDNWKTEIKVEVNQLLNKIILSGKQLYLAGVKEGIKLIKEIEKMS